VPAKIAAEEFAFYEVKDFKKWLTREDKSSLLSLHSPDKLDSDTWVLEKPTISCSECSANLPNWGYPGQRGDCERYSNQRQ
jgi:hypothetical protein